MDLIFDSLNVYQTLRAITADSPELLVEALTAIRTQIKIINIVAQNGRYTAFVMGHLPSQKRTSKKNKE
jgi:hypothetical protein